MQIELTPDEALVLFGNRPPKRALPPEGVATEEFVTGIRCPALKDSPDWDPSLMDEAPCKDWIHFSPDDWNNKDVAQRWYHIEMQQKKVT